MTYTANSFPRQITFSAKYLSSAYLTKAIVLLEDAQPDQVIIQDVQALTSQDLAHLISLVNLARVFKCQVCVRNIHEDALGLIQYLKLTAVINKPYVMPKHQQMRE